MSRNRLHRAIEVDGKTVEYAINRRGCKGRWTKKDEEAMRALVAAAVRRDNERLKDKPASPSGRSDP